MDIVKIFSGSHSTIPQFLESPIKTLRDFEDLKWRLDSGSPERFSVLINSMIEYSNSFADNFTAIYVCWLFGTFRHLMGLSGYIASIDHTVPPEVSLKNFRIYLEIMRGLS